MKMRSLITTCLLYFSVLHFGVSQENIVTAIDNSSPDKTRVGLTLSGGAAKGFSHIGILMAIDSAGLEIDAITGTSSGAIVGSLYSIGYSGKELRDIALQMNWTNLFLGNRGLDQVNFMEKEFYKKSLIEVPLQDGKVKAYTGVLETNGLWQEFLELYYPVNDVKEFCDFSIPFACMATDLLTGESIMVKNGDITKAIRASMAMPSIFTAVRYENRTLIDGGVTNNFPVKELDSFDIDYKIGVNLHKDVEDVKEIENPMDVIMHMSLYKDAINFHNQKAACDLLIEPDMGEYNGSSFADLDSIVEIGIKTGLEYYPYFKKLADSLNSVNKNPCNPIGNRLPGYSSFLVDSVRVYGLKNVTRKNFMGHLGIKIGENYQVVDVRNAVSKAYEYLRYRNINYEFHIEGNHRVLEFYVKEEPQVHVQLGLHYTPFSGTGVVAGINERNKFARNSTSRVRLNISENFRGLAEHVQFFNATSNLGIEGSLYYEFLKLPIFEDFEQQSVYNTNFAQFRMNLFKLIDKSGKISLGLATEYHHLQPKVSPENAVIARNFRHKAFFMYERNTLDDRSYPSKGIRVQASATVIFAQSPDADFISLSEVSASTENAENNVGSYPKLQVDAQRYIPLSSRFTLTSKINTGINFISGNSFLDFYTIGGTRNYLRNQVTFSGFREGKLMTNSFAGTELGLQYEFMDNFYLNYRASAGVFGFFNGALKLFDNNDYVIGHALSIGYLSFGGPMEFAFLYNNQTKQLGINIQLGYSF